MSKGTLRLILGSAAVVIVAVVGILMANGGEPAGSTHPPGHAVPGSAQIVGGINSNPSSLPSIKESMLPPAAKVMLKIIRSNGPFPYSRDGIHFGNFEGILPREANGYYREYTVGTPGSSDRGAQRIIVGKPGDKYYTDDHYGHFKFIVEGS